MASPTTPTERYADTFRLTSMYLSFLDDMDKHSGETLLGFMDILKTRIPNITNEAQKAHIKATLAYVDSLVADQMVTFEAAKGVTQNNRGTLTSGHFQTFYVNEKSFYFHGVNSDPKFELCTYQTANKVAAIVTQKGFITKLYKDLVPPECVKKGIFKVEISSWNQEKFQGTVEQVGEVCYAILQLTEHTTIITTEKAGKA